MYLKKAAVYFNSVVRSSVLGNKSPLTDTASVRRKESRELVWVDTGYDSQGTVVAKNKWKIQLEML